jgi:hypothetical protein
MSEVRGLTTAKLIDKMRKVASGASVSEDGAELIREAADRLAYYVGLPVEELAEVETSHRRTPDFLKAYFASQVIDTHDRSV